MTKWYMKHRPGCPFDFAPLDVCDCIEKNMGERIADLEVKLAEAELRGWNDAIEAAAEKALVSWCAEKAEGRIISASILTLRKGEPT